MNNFGILAPSFRRTSRRSEAYHNSGSEVETRQHSRDGDLAQTWTMTKDYIIEKCAAYSMQFSVLLLQTQLSILYEEPHLIMPFIARGVLPSSGFSDVPHGYNWFALCSRV